MKIFNNLLLVIRQFFFPRNCALCGRFLNGVSEIEISICENCSKTLTIASGEKCILCGKPLISEIEMCLNCRKKIEGSAQNSFIALDRLWVLFPYTGKYRTLLSEYKFKKNLCLAGFFANLILNVIAENPELQNLTVVPIPPRPGKIKEAGWDQVDYLVKILKKKSRGSVKINKCLKRKKSKVQKKLNRIDRLNNLKGRIYLKEKPPDNVLIIDDVITTGSTLEVCSDVLKDGGINKVYALCLFYD